MHPLPPLYAASVPVFRHYLGQMSAVVERAGREMLGAQIADAFPAGQQFATAVGFAMRAACPLSRRDVPDLPHALGPRLAVARAVLGAMRPADFEGAEDVIVRHTAGFAEIEQSGADFLYLFALPNFFFHLTMGYATLRNAGMDLGKGDFDGWHRYPADFRFGES
jgi:uncharacterized protein